MSWRMLLIERHDRPGKKRLNDISRNYNKRIVLIR